MSALLQCCDSSAVILGTYFCMIRVNHQTSTMVSQQPIGNKCPSECCERGCRHCCNAATALRQYYLQQFCMIRVNHQKSTSVSYVCSSFRFEHGRAPIPQGTVARGCRHWHCCSPHCSNIKCTVSYDTCQSSDQYQPRISLSEMSNSIRKRQDLGTNARRRRVVTLKTMFLHY